MIGHQTQYDLYAHRMPYASRSQALTLSRVGKERRETPRILRNRRCAKEGISRRQNAGVLASKGVAESLVSGAVDNDSCARSSDGRLEHEINANQQNGGARRDKTQNTIALTFLRLAIFITNSGNVAKKLLVRQSSSSCSSCTNDAGSSERQLTSSLRQTGFVARI